LQRTLHPYTFYCNISLSAKSWKSPNQVYPFPINRLFWFHFRKVSPPVAYISFIFSRQPMKIEDYQAFRGLTLGKRNSQPHKIRDWRTFHMHYKLLADTNNIFCKFRKRL
jgi:hypothetical protein